MMKIIARLIVLFNISTTKLLLYFCANQSIALILICQFFLSFIYITVQTFVTEVLEQYLI